jgi:hypothetical protein
MIQQTPGPPPKRQEERELRIRRMLRSKPELSFAANPLPTRLDASGRLMDEVFADSRRAAVDP